jgi:hypothetical protein
LTLAPDDQGVAAMIQATRAPDVGMARATSGSVENASRREGPISMAPGEAARELDAEVARLLRVRGGELAEPSLWARPRHRRDVEAIVADLLPIRSRIALLSSWERESGRGSGRGSGRSSALRLAYAIVWLRLAQRRAGECGPHARGRVRAGGNPRRLALTRRG